MNPLKDPYFTDIANWRNVHIPTLLNPQKIYKLKKETGIFYVQLA